MTKSNLPPGVTNGDIERAAGAFEPDPDTEAGIRLHARRYVEEVLARGGRRRFPWKKSLTEAAMIEAYVLGYKWGMGRRE